MDDIFSNLLEAGILEESAKGIYHFADDPSMASVNHFSLWDIAGALMEKCAKENSLDGRTIALSFGVGMFCATRAGSASPTYGVYLERTNKSAPRAIIESCTVALEAEK